MSTTTTLVSSLDDKKHTPLFLLPYTSSLFTSILHGARHIARLESRFDTLLKNDEDFTHTQQLSTLHKRKKKYPFKGENEREIQTKNKLNEIDIDLDLAMEKNEVTSSFNLIFTSSGLVLKQHVEYLVKSFESISASLDQSTPSTLRSYVSSLSIRIQALQNALPKSLHATTNTTPTRVQVQSHPDPLAHVQRGMKVHRVYEDQQKKELLKPFPSTVSTTTPTTLDHHAALQAKLAADLVAMTSQLKAHSKAFAEHLTIDAKTLQTAASVLAQNQTRMHGTTHRLKSYTLTSRATAWTLCWVIFVMCCITITMYLVIRLF
ncbi:hypothetical protein HMI54_011919 [Coelomomyces lativittatus]|nr:hypothetical protein HMI56_003662 [Coelomomyces lativittatus]KAJ1515656.1 hypothetical protein HMI54_011919 [Coelomomyces lativittatus]KAJ1516909.1 hypothetical protein HMI55_001099 [Coelomomyces lativittatus]